MRFDIGPYDPCPCGSGQKYKFCCAARSKANRQGKFPVGTVALYGPDDKTTTKIAAGVILHDGAEPILKRWVSTTIIGDPKVADEIKRFFARYGVRNVVVTEGNLGCPHEEGEDYPEGQDCPFCPFWAGKQGSAERSGTDAGDWADDDEELDELASGDALDEEDDDDIEDDQEERDWDASYARMEAVLGDRKMNFAQAVDALFAHLQANLQLPCEVTGGEDFQWEEPYVLGGWSRAEYKRLKRTQPSYRDRFQLLRISRGDYSRWMMFGAEDIAAHVRRISDGKEFILGLVELEAADRNSPNHQLLDDYSVWFVNSR